MASTAGQLRVTDFLFIVNIVHHSQTTVTAFCWEKTKLLEASVVFIDANLSVS